MARGAANAGRSTGRDPAPAPVRELRARGRNTRRRLLDAGARVFATRGYHATRVDDIVKVAATSHGTFYLYFANKEALFAALAEEVSDEMQQLAAELRPLRAGADGAAELRAWIDEFATLYERYAPVIRAWTEAEMGDSDFGRLGTDVLRNFTRALTARVAEAAPPGIDPAVASMALVAMLERFNYFAHTEQVDVDRADMVDTLARVTHASLFGAVS